MSKAKVEDVLAAWTSDDEHTGAEGAYSRMLKARKWLYATAAVAVLHANKLIDLAALKNLTGKVVQLPAQLLTAFVIASLIYLLAQYGLLIVQLIGSYRTLLTARLPDSQQTFDMRMGIRNTQSQINSLRGSLSEAREDDEKKRLLDELGREHSRLELYDEGLEASLKADPTAQPYFRISEVLIDIGRSSVPFVSGALALLHIAIARPA